jgi:hypothetical protein
MERLAIGLILIPLGLLGVWLVRTTHRKRRALPSRIYARGIFWGVALIVVSLVLMAVAIAQAVGIDFHLADVFG